MRNVKPRHGSIFLLAAYIGGVGDYTRLVVSGGGRRLPLRRRLRVLLQVLVFRRMEGQELRQTLVTSASRS